MFLKMLNLSWNRLRGQCYDGCSTTRGHRNGLAKSVKDLEQHAVKKIKIYEGLNGNGE